MYWHLNQKGKNHVHFNNSSTRGEMKVLSITFVLVFGNYVLVLKVNVTHLHITN